MTAPPAAANPATSGPRRSDPSSANGATTSAEALTAAAASSPAPPEASQPASTSATPAVISERHQRVVVRAADDVDQHQGVERDQRRGAGGVRAA